MIKWYPYVGLLLSLIFVVYFYFEQKKFHQWIYIYWGKRPTLYRNLQLFLYAISTVFFLMSLADWRGAETTLEGKRSTEKTILLIDNSLSMLAEDVRPNRYEKAILMARHFLKAAPGHEISVVLFSDIVRKYVPFTTDIDLLDARISGLKELYKNVGGSSNIKQAIRESLDFLDPNPLARKGNIIVFSDADDMDADFPLDIGPSVSVALIAIATATGAPIPVRDRDGVLKGYKKFQGEQVTSKLNQQFLDSLSSQIKNYKYWVATSFSLPTNEILEFLRNKGIDGEGGSQNMRSREVLYVLWLIPAILFLILSYVFKRMKTWSILQILFVCILLWNIAPRVIVAQENKVKEIMPLLDALKANQLNQKGRLSTAQKLLEAGDPEKALKIYHETLENEPVNENNKLSWLNYAQALAANKKSYEAIQKLQQVQEYQDKQPEDKNFSKIYAESLLSILQSQEKEQKQKEDKEKKEKKDKPKDDDKKEGDKKPDDKKEGDEQKKDDQQKGDKEQKEKDAEKKDGQDKKSRSERQKELSSLLKQLLNEDRNLQQKLMETSTKDPTQKHQGPDSDKDW